MGFNTGFIDGTTDLGQTTTFIDKDPFSEGSLWLTGRNQYYITALVQYNSGILGINTMATLAVSSPVQTVAGGNNWKQIDINTTQAAGIKTDGTLWTWGLNDFGQLGSNSITPRSSPGQTVSTATNWKQVSVSGGVSSSASTAAIKTDGTLWTWGDNTYGQLGVNSVVPKSSPVQVAGSTWKQVSVSPGGCMFAVKTDGTLWMWGASGLNSLDTTGTTGGLYSTPIQIGTDTNWKKVIVSTLSVRAIKTDGTLWMWGRSVNGDLGVAPSTVLLTPTNVIGGEWKDICVSYSYTAGIKSDNTLWTWGLNTYGYLGNNESGNSYSSPVQIYGGGTWSKVGYCSAIKTDGTLWTWGYNSAGQVGDGTTTHRSSPVQILTNYKFKTLSGDSYSETKAFIADEI